MVNAGTFSSGAALLSLGLSVRETLFAQSIGAVLLVIGLTLNAAAGVKHLAEIRRSNPVVNGGSDRFGLRTWGIPFCSQQIYSICTDAQWGDVWSYLELPNHLMVSEWMEWVEFIGYPLVMNHIALENHNFTWVNPLETRNVHFP